MTMTFWGHNVQRKKYQVVNNILPTYLLTCWRAMIALSYIIHTVPADDIATGHYHPWY